MPQRRKLLIAGVAFLRYVDGPHAKGRIARIFSTLS